MPVFLKRITMRQKIPLIAAVAILIACSKPQPQEVQRFPSPSGEWDAVLVEWPTSALDGFLTGVVLLSRGEKISAKSRGSITGEAIDPTGIHWTGERELSVKYAAGSQLYTFENRWYAPTAYTGKDATFVEIVAVRQSLAASPTGKRR